MRSTILTILPPPEERQLPPRAALAQPGTAPAQGGSPAQASVLPSIESVILQKLLAEMESRQLTRAQPTYVIEQPPAARHTTLVRALWAILWVLSIGFCIVSVKYFDSQTMVPKSEGGSPRSIEELAANIGDQRKEFSTMAASLESLAQAIASSSKRAEMIPAMLSQLGSEMQQSRPAIRQPVEPTAERALPAMISLPHEPDSAPIPMGGHVHPPIEFAVAPPDAVVHHNAQGVMDYWLVPRTVDGTRTMAKVVPVLQTSQGTFVHHIAEVKDYIVTPTGDWIVPTEAEGHP
jgi:hypothetical protein